MKPGDIRSLARWVLHGNLKPRVAIAPASVSASTNPPPQARLLAQVAGDTVLLQSVPAIMEHSLILLRHMHLVADTYQIPYSIFKPNIYTANYPSG